MPTLKNVNVVSIQVTDWERAKKFYTELLEWPVAWADDGIGWMEFGKDGEAHVAINRRGEHEPAPGAGGTTLVFSVDDIHAAVAALRAKGVKCDDAFIIPNVVAYATFYDPEGNRLQMAATPPAA